METKTKIIIGLGLAAVAGVLIYTKCKNKSEQEEEKSNAIGGMWCDVNCSGSQRAFCKNCKQCPTLPCFGGVNY